MGKGSGAGGARGGGGGGGAQSSVGSSSNPVTSGQLDQMSASERTSALRAMPEGTIVSKRATAGDEPTRYRKDGPDSWSMEVKSREFSNRTGKFSIKKSWSPVPATSSQLAQQLYSSSSFSSVKYPNKG